MKTLAFSEHSGIMEWYHKKKALESAGMKYVHAIEAYLTTTLSEKIRDNYHCVLIAKNYDGFWELNRLVSQSFNRADNHFYYVPRISFDEPVWTRWNEYYTNDQSAPFSERFDFFMIRLPIHIFRTISEQIQKIRLNGVVMCFLNPRSRSCH